MNPSQGAKASFFEKLLKASRKLELEYEWACSNPSESAAKVRAIAADFLGAYAEFNQIGPEKALASYLDFNQHYVKDIQAYLATGKYPLETDPQLRGIGRTDYDLALIVSILVAPHRCAIMEGIFNTPVQGRPLVIGVGSGVELGFIPAPEGGEAYDLYINGYAWKAFPKWNFHEEWYRLSNRRYGAVYAIELLEHLTEPYALVEACLESLEAGGRFMTTTATHVPQFDHRYNFLSDEVFEKRVTALGFEMESKRVLPHEYALMNIRAGNDRKGRNVFYVFRKK